MCLKENLSRNFYVKCLTFVSQCKWGDVSAIFCCAKFVVISADVLMTTCSAVVGRVLDPSSLTWFCKLLQTLSASLNSDSCFKAQEGIAVPSDSCSLCQGLQFSWNWYVCLNAVSLTVDFFLQWQWIVNQMEYSCVWLFISCKFFLPERVCCRMLYSFPWSPANCRCRFVAVGKIPHGVLLLDFCQAMLISFLVCPGFPRFAWKPLKYCVHCKFCSAAIFFHCAAAHWCAVSGV